MTALANSVFPRTLVFLKAECSQALYHGTGSKSEGALGVQEVQSFLNILSAFMDKHLLREDQEKMHAHELSSKNNLHHLAQKVSLAHTL